MSHSIKELRKDFVPSPSRLWYNEWVEKNASGNVLDVGKSRYWDYGFPTIDIAKGMKPTFLGDICDSGMETNCFNTILCNGMLEFVSSPQLMVNEIYRILVPGGVAIFGFVGKDYKPYKREWLFYEEGDIDFKDFEITEKKSFDNNYHFITCKK